MPTTITTTAPRRFVENGKTIRSVRLRTGQSQKTFAVTVGTTRRNMIRLENGENRPSGPLRDRICAAAGVAISAIASSDDQDEEGGAADVDTDLSRALHSFVQQKVAAALEQRRAES